MPCRMLVNWYGSRDFSCGCRMDQMAVWVSFQPRDGWCIVSLGRLNELGGNEYSVQNRTAKNGYAKYNQGFIINEE